MAGVMTSIYNYGIQLSTLQWRHNEHVGVSNHQPHDCLLNRLFKVHVEENIKAPRRWPLCGEFTGHRWIPHKGPVTRKMFPFDDVIMDPCLFTFCVCNVKRVWKCKSNFAVYEDVKIYFIRETGLGSYHEELKCKFLVVIKLVLWHNRM